jgi:hypothetical protein
MKDKLFKPDYNKELYKIEIIVCKNSNEFKVQTIEKDYNITYESIIGSLEITKMNLITRQSEANRKEYKKLKKHK